MTDILSIITLIAGVLMSLSYYPQAYKIYKSKRSKDVSLLTYSLLSIGAVIWLIYGIIRADIVIIASFAFGAIGANLVLFLTLIYRKN